MVALEAVQGWMLTETPNCRGMVDFKTTPFWHALFFARDQSGLDSASITWGV